MAYADFQYQTYLAGVGGTKPEFPMSLPGIEEAARQKMTERAYGYVAGGATSEDTVAENLAAFRRWRLVPRALEDVGTRDLSVELFGSRFESPVLLAPIGVQSIVHEDGELATARAASKVGVPIVLSTAASNSIEDVATASGGGPRWFQLYWPTGEEVMASFVRRAEAAGYEAIVVTIDTRLLAWRPRDLDAAYLPFLSAEGVANYLTDPAFKGLLEKSPEEDIGAAVMQWAAQFANPGLSWDHLPLIRKYTKLPVLLKGILHPDDARRALDVGIDGIVVSNHGGRQVDGAIATLDALPEVVEAVGDRVPVLLDSGIRTGADICKALALGARAVLLGRPFVWGLGLAGEAGVEHVVRSILADLDLTVALLGLDSIRGLDAHMLRRPA
ncbi:MAG TPA: lactate 2-monooxygenase [Actinomycetota bacterium]|nr:lactate 2-monooxygenase [Actinomycetota bacterium]